MTPLFALKYICEVPSSFLLLVVTDLEMEKRPKLVTIQTLERNNRKTTVASTIAEVLEKGDFIFILRQVYMYI
jgi:hypothetical protein